MQAGMDEGAHMDHGGGRQHAEMLGAAGILHKPEEEALSPQVYKLALKFSLYQFINLWILV